MNSTADQATDTGKGGEDQGAGNIAALLSPRQQVLIGALATIAFTVVVAATWGSGLAFPANVGEDIGLRIDEAVDWTTREGAWLFSSIKKAITTVLVGIQDGLLWVPWPAFILAVGLISLKMVGWRMSVFTTVVLLAVGFLGLWRSAMETIALITVTVTISVVIAIPIGIAAARNNVLDALIRPVLDAMQTLPSFVYLVPAIMFFSLGNVPAVFASVIYAVPPGIRLTNLGIRQVSSDVVEAARAFGATPTQLLLKVEIPMAVPTIMTGVNQTTMMALAMVVIASMVGAGGLGEDVLRGLGRQKPGDAVIAGLGIVVFAIIIDRITQAFARARRAAVEGERA